MKQSVKNNILKQSKAGYINLLNALKTRSPLAADDKKIVNLRRQVAATGEDALAFERALLEGEGYAPCFFEGAEKYAAKAIAEEKANAAAAAAAKKAAEEQAALERKWWQNFQNQLEELLPKHTWLQWMRDLINEDRVDDYLYENEVLIAYGDDLDRFRWKLEYLLWSSLYKRHGYLHPEQEAAIFWARKNSDRPEIQTIFKEFENAVTNHWGGKLWGDNALDCAINMWRIIDEDDMNYMPFIFVDPPIDKAGRKLMEAWEAAPAEEKE